MWPIIIICDGSSEWSGCLLLALTIGSTDHYKYLLRQIPSSCQQKPSYFDPKELWKNYLKGSFLGAFKIEEGSCDKSFLMSLSSYNFGEIIFKLLGILATGWLETFEIFILYSFLLKYLVDGIFIRVKIFIVHSWMTHDSLWLIVNFLTSSC